MLTKFKEINLEKKLLSKKGGASIVKYVINNVTIDAPPFFKSGSFFSFTKFLNLFL